MREIKLRAKDKKGKIHYSYGVFVEHENEIDEETIVQFTGLLDKNGNEIYEGDIVKIFDMLNHDVMFKNAAFGYLSAKGTIHEQFMPFCSVFLGLGGKDNQLHNVELVNS